MDTSILKSEEARCIRTSQTNTWKLSKQDGRPGNLRSSRALTLALRAGRPFTGI